MFILPEDAYGKSHLDPGSDPVGRAYICDECIMTCAAILEEDRQGSELGDGVEHASGQGGVPFQHMAAVPEIRFDPTLPSDGETSDDFNVIAIPVRTSD